MQRWPRLHAWPGELPPHLQTRVAFLPCYRLCLKAPKPLPFVLSPKTLAQHLRKRRWVLRQLQRQAAAQMGVSYWAYLKWELGRALPSKSLMPRVIEYLGIGLRVRPPEFAAEETVPGGAKSDAPRGGSVG